MIGWLPELDPPIPKLVLHSMKSCQGWKVLSDWLCLRGVFHSLHTALKEYPLYMPQSIIFHCNAISTGSYGSLNVNRICRKRGKKSCFLMIRILHENQRVLVIVNPRSETAKHTKEFYKCQLTVWVAFLSFVFFKYVTRICIFECNVCFYNVHRVSRTVMIFCNSWKRKLFSFVYSSGFQ